MKRLLLIALLSFALHTLHAQRRQSDNSPFPVKQNNHWGYVDDSGAVVIPIQYDAAEPFTGKYAVVAKDRKRYAINKSGEIVTPRGFDWLNLLSDSLLAVREGKKWGLVRLDGEQVVPMRYDEIQLVTKTLVGFRSDSLWGYCTTRGTMLVEARCDTAYVVGFRYLRYEAHEKTGLVSFDGTSLLDPICDDIKLDNGVVFYRIGPNWGCRRIADNRDLFTPSWTSWEMLGTRLVKTMSDSSVALYDVRNGLLFDAGRYDNFACIRPNRVLLTRDTTFGIADTSGKLILPCTFEEIAWLEEDRWSAQNKNSWQLYDDAGRKLSEKKYDWIGPFDDHLAGVGMGGRHGLINVFGNEIVAATNDPINTNDPQHIKITNEKTQAVTIVELDENGRLIDRNSYAELHTISIGSRSTAPTIATGVIAANSATGVDSLSSDTLVWFLSARNHKWGLKNRITNDTLLKAQFASVADYRTQRVTLVEVSVSSKGPTINGKTWMFDSRFGLVDSRTGRYIIPPRFTDLNMNDYVNQTFKGYIRAISSDGLNGLVSLDGRGAFLPYLYIDDPVNGVARACVRGRWKLADRNKHEKNAIMTMQQLTASFTRDLTKWAVKNDVGVNSRRKLCIEDGQWTIISATSGIMLTFDEKRNDYIYYSHICPIKGTTAIVREGTRWGAIDMRGHRVLEPTFVNVDYLKGSDARLLEVASYDERYGYFNSLAQVAIKPDIERSKMISEDLVGTKLKGRWGFRDTIGRWVVGADYTDVHPFSEGLAAVKKKGRWGYIDRNGNSTIETTYEGAGDFSGGMAWVKKKGRYGFIDASGTLVIENKFRTAANFSGGAAPAREKQRWGLIDASGKWIHKPAWHSLQPYGKGVFIATRGRHYKLIDAEGKPTCNRRLDRINPAAEGLAPVRVRNSWGYTDSLGNMAIDPSFEGALPFSNGLAAVRMNGRYGYIDRNGTMVIEPTYAKANPFSCGLAYVRKRDTTGYIDRSGKMRIPLVSAGAGPFRENKAVVHDWKGQAYFIGTDGQALFGKTFDDAQDFNHGYAAVRIDDCWGVIDSTGMLVVQPHLADVEDFHEGFARFKQNAFYGVYSATGKELVRPECDRVFMVSPHLYRVESGEEIGYLDDKGRWIWALQR